MASYWDEKDTAGKPKAGKKGRTIAGFGGKSAANDWDAFDAKYGTNTGGKATTSSTVYSKCSHSHPALKLPGTDFVVHGGSCYDPIIPDADIYIGFDGGMRMSPKSYPWNGGTEVLFKITDMCAPSDPAEFKKLIKWSKEQIDAGKKIHAGCIGGHGRTGTYLAALVSLYGEKDAIEYVRKNYCEKAVETGSQINFLVKHFGVVKADPSKAHAAHDYGSKGGTVIPIKPSLSGRPMIFAPMENKGSIWEAPLRK